MSVLIWGLEENGWKVTVLFNAVCTGLGIVPKCIACDISYFILLYLHLASYS